MQVADGSGATAYDGGVALAWTADDDRSVGTFTLPSQGVTVWVVGTLGSGDTLVRPGQMRIELYDATTGDPITQQTLDQGVPAVVDGLTFTFARETEFTGLAVARDPGTNLVWLGALLLAGGFMAVFFLPMRRVWARMVVGPDGRGVIQLAAPLNNHFGADQAYADLVTDLQAACASPLSA
jgi:cytochrome c biogenesis protein